MYEEFLTLQEKIEKARNTDSNSIDLSSTRCFELPEELFSFSDLEELNLNRCHIKDVSSLERFPNLKKLHLIDCSGLKKFPNLIYLEVISWGDLASQEARTLLEDICELSALQHLDFAGLPIAHDFQQTFNLPTHFINNNKTSIALKIRDFLANIKSSYSWFISKSNRETTF